jgi:lysozyme family protein
MKTTFSQSLALTLKFEGGYANDPRDPGGATFQGVTQRRYNIYRRHKGLQTQPIRSMTFKERDEIYRAGYWDEINADSLPVGVDMLAFDIAVNSGPGRAQQWLALCAGQEPMAQIRYLDRKRRYFWRQLTTWAHFGRGWTSREDAVLECALGICRGDAAT